MKGKVSKYFELKGFGFIVDENMKNRFFHISEVSNLSELKNNCEVEFQGSDNEKGLTAIGIKILKTKNANKFINISETRIKLSNIKTYGTATRNDVEYEDYKINHEAEGFFQKASDVFNKIAKGLEGIEYETEGDGFGNKEYHKMRKIKDDEFYTRTETKTREKVSRVRYLYITTYQGDNYTWDENKIDIDKKIKELDGIV